MAIPTYIDSGAVATDLTGAASTVPTIIAHNVGDFLLVLSQNSNGDVQSLATPNGFTLGGNVNGTDSFLWAWKIATATNDTGPTITAANTDQFTLCIIIRGTDATNPIHAGGAVGDFTTATATPATGAITTSVADCLLLHVTARPSNTGPSSGRPPAGWAAPNLSTSSSGTTAGFWSITKDVATPATTASVTASTWAASLIWAGVTLALQPPVAATIIPELVQPLYVPTTPRGVDPRMLALAC